MNKRNVILWILSVAMLASNIFLIRYYVFHSSVKLSVYLLIYLIVGGAFYTIVTKISTHPKGYTCVQALFFYIVCKKNGITTEKAYSKHVGKVEEIAKKYEFSKNLNRSDLFDLYKNGRNIYKK
ncbi:MAG: hypothetical protein IKL10_05650 [Clostridia bacterium]|nr:hypothetical protein [Clostridia bacterium]